MAFGTPPAMMGFVGYVQFDFPGQALIIRATSADVRLIQEITKPDVIDGRFDRSLYQLGPKIVEGTVEYPAIMERSGGNLDPAAKLYTAAVQRETSGDRLGRLLNSNLFDLSVRYTSQFAEFKYKRCIVNQWRFSATQSDVARVSVDLIGETREPTTLSPLTTTSPGFPQNSRIVTWNDVVVNIKGARGAPDISGDYIRNFEATYNNNADRFYTFNGRLFPQDIAVRKRDIDGNITLLGRHEQLGEHARTNEDRCYEENEIQFGYELSRDDCNATFLVTAINVVFRIEEIALTNDVFETTVQWHSFPDQIDLASSTLLDTGGTVA